MRTIFLALIAFFSVFSASAETIPATLSTETMAQGQAWRIDAIFCGTQQRIPASGYVYSSAQSAADAVSQEALDWRALANIGNCSAVGLYTGRRGSVESISSTQSVLRGDVIDGQAVVYSNLALVNLSQGGSCPEGWEVSGIQCQRETYTCPEDGGWTLEGATCTREQCFMKLGQKTVQNFTTGWAALNTPNSSKVISYDLPWAGACDGTCKQNLDRIKECYWSQVPAANGLHRVSCDLEVTYTGGSCTAVSDTADPGAPAPPCVGTQGSVNGKPVCFGTPASPQPALPNDPNAPPAGPGNPAAGEKPAAGSGSGDGGEGRTPVSGSGGNSGGGSNAAKPGGGSDGNGQSGGGGGTKDGTSERPADPCGLPGRPACKLDESGMPGGEGNQGTNESGLATGRDGAITNIDQAKSMQAPGWTWTFQLPTGCSPIPLAAFDPYLTGIDVCEYQPVIHDLMSLVWVAAAIWGCIAMVGRTVGGAP